MKKEIASKYNPQKIEGKWYQYWEKQGFFHSEINQKPSYTIVIPPPNVTGILHMGHMLNNTLQDVLIRRARMNGLNACWVPGTDHASIATEAKVVKQLAEKGLKKDEIGREAFLDKAWEWTEKYGGTILSQLKTLGASCDWERTKFTLDNDLSESVTSVFITLYQKGLIYRETKMINWDPEAKTTVSDEEVIYEETQSKLFYLKYKIQDSDEFLTIATTRPETIFGDTAICINPKDERYTHLNGKTVIVPIVEREIPIIFDEYVDVEFGTGCLKVTPAHDMNDNAIGKKHNLEVIDIFDDSANLNQFGLHYSGKNRFAARKEIAKELESSDSLLKTEYYTNKVGKSERTKSVIEPKLSVQWFLRMEEIAKKALDVVEKGEVKFHPSHYVNTYKHWLNNIKDWNISRQLWWGHRIPAYFYGDGLSAFVVAESAEKALEIAKEETGNPDLTLKDLRQEEDVLDTWFSSWLWPISVFDGIRNPENPEIEYYYPTADLVTAPDIIFFWVARMIMAGNEFTQKIPFKNVYFTGIVRDKQRRKMSKQLGNSPNPEVLIEQFGADGIRVGLLLSSSAGNDLMFDEELCLQGRNFANKIWNAFRLIKSWMISDDEGQTESTAEGIKWFEQRLKQINSWVEKDYESFRISDALLKIYKLIWNDFCSSYLEIIKPEYGKGVDPKTYEKTITFFETLLKLLHPFMPFLTEEIWQTIKERTDEEAIMISQFTKFDTSFDEKILNEFNAAMEVLSEIRTFRKDKNVPQKEGITVYSEFYEFPISSIVKKLANARFSPLETKESQNYSFRAGLYEFFIPIEGLIDLEGEKEKITQELKHLKGFLASVKKKLSNQRFVENAPEKVVALERKKQSDAQEKIAILNESLAKIES